MSNTEKRSRRNQQQQQHQQQHDPEQQQSHNHTTDSDDQETPIDYLSHNNTTTLIKDAVRVLLANRPDDQLQFLVDFFAPSASEIVVNAYDKLSWTHYSMPVYQRNSLEVYDSLVGMKNEDSRLMGLLGGRFNELLHKLTSDLPADFIEMTYARVKVRDDLVVSFNRFYHSVLLLHVLKDFTSLVKAMHKDLDAQEVGKVGRKLCTLVIERLFASFTQSAVKSDMTFDRSFSHSFLANADAQTLDEKNSLNETEFVKACISRFLHHSL